MLCYIIENISIQLTTPGNILKLLNGIDFTTSVVEFGILGFWDGIWVEKRNIIPVNRDVFVLA
jgi:hypothetical protein